jgi:single-strand DNA-binding protein
MRIPPPSIGSSGNITPQSMTIAVPAHSIAIRLRPISPNPPRAIILIGFDMESPDGIALSTLPQRPKRLYKVENHAESGGFSRLRIGRAPLFTAPARLACVRREAGLACACGGGQAMSVNKVILVGRLGKDPQIRYTASQQPVANFTLATSERFTDRSGSRQERTEWHNIVAWGKTAELCGEYLKKGREVYVEGRLQTRSYDAKDGSGKRYVTEIVAQTVQFLGGRAAAGGGEPGDFGGGGPSGGAPGSGGEETPMDDEDIPF